MPATASISSASRCLSPAPFETPQADLAGETDRRRATSRCSPTASAPGSANGAMLRPRARRKPSARARGDRAVPSTRAAGKDQRRRKSRTAMPPVHAGMRRSGRSGCSARPSRSRCRRPKCRKARRCNFRWRRALYRVARAEGPERIAPEWWREEAGRARRPATISASRTRTAAATGSTGRASTAPPSAAALVPAWAFRMNALATRLCRIRHPVEFLLPARRLQAGGTGRRRRAARACRQSALPTATRWRASCAPGSRRRSDRHRLSSRAAAWSFATARPTCSPIRRTARAGAICAAC